MGSNPQQSLNQFLPCPEKGWALSLKSTFKIFTNRHNGFWAHFSGWGGLWWCWSNFLIITKWYFEPEVIMQTSIIWANNTNKIAVMTCSMILFQKKTCITTLYANFKPSVSFRLPIFITAIEQQIKSKTIPINWNWSFTALSTTWIVSCHLKPTT